MQLLGKDCYDIDVAIDNMLGREFCEKINEYLIKTGEDVQGIGVTIVTLIRYWSLLGLILMNVTEVLFLESATFYCEAEK